MHSALQTEMIERDDESEKEYPLTKVRSIQSTSVNENLKQINEIQKRIALIESEGKDSAFFVPIKTKPELKVYFEDLVQELDGFKLPKDNPVGFHWMADQKRFHVLNQKKDPKYIYEREDVQNIMTQENSVLNKITDESYRQKSVTISYPA